MAESAFDQSWANPLDSLGAPPKIDYPKAVEAKKDVLTRELADVNKITADTSAQMAKYGAVADKKLQQIESFDPNQIKPWNTEEEKAKYQTSPFEAFGSFAMVASLGMAAFTKTPFINSMNAMAGVINGMQDAKDKNYDRAYKAWQDNNKLLMERFGVMRDQMQDAFTMMKERGEIGKINLANTLTKYGLVQDLALLNAGFDDVLATKWAANAKAFEGMAKTSQEIENLHASREAVKFEEEKRAQLGLPPLDPQEKLEIQRSFTEAKTPEQMAQADAWRSFLREHPGATSEQKSQFLQGLRSYGRGAAGLQSAPAINLLRQVAPDISPTEEAIIRSALDTKGVKGAATVARMSDAIDQIKAAADNGTPMDPGQRSQLIKQAAAGGGTGGPDQGGLDLAAENWIKTGQFPSRNWEANQKILAIADQKLKDAGIDKKDLPKLQQEFKSQQVAIQRYESGPQGQQTGAINMVIHHIGTMRKLAEALDNGDYTLANWIGNKATTEIGKPEPNDFILAGQIVMTEAMRAMGVAGAGTGDEREGLRARVSENFSAPVINHAADVMQELLAGKLFANRLAFPVATGLPVSRFDALLSERTKSILFPLIQEDKPVETRTDAPPVNLLEEGKVTPFKNGQYWTLKNGKPMKVEKP